LPFTHYTIAIFTNMQFNKLGPCAQSHTLELHTTDRAFTN
jgi:hypothetical protein